jgi:hypothetical protein
MADDGKRHNNVCTKLTDRMLIDLGRACAIDDVTQSDFIYRLLRRELYGRSMHTDSLADRLTSATGES